MNAMAAEVLAPSPSINPEFKTAQRQQTSLLAPLERVCLNWLARNMPPWVKPDHLTLLGLVAMLMAGACYAIARWWPAASYNSSSGVALLSMVVAAQWTTTRVPFLPSKA